MNVCCRVQRHFLCTRANSRTNSVVRSAWRILLKICVHGHGHVLNCRLLQWRSHQGHNIVTHVLSQIADEAIRSTVCGVTQSRSTNTPQSLHCVWEESCGCLQLTTDLESIFKIRRRTRKGGLILNWYNLLHASHKLVKTENSRKIRMQLIINFSFIKKNFDTVDHHFEWGTSTMEILVFIA